PDQLDAAALRSIGIDLNAVRRSIEESFGPGALDSPPERCTHRGPRRRIQRGHIPFTPRSKKVLKLSLREALHLHHSHVGTEHVLLGLLREGHGIATRALTEMGVDPARIRAHLMTEIRRTA
ncbi:MAG: Clp protease N-terminal domain-containing protein, partial [Sciscionella sp.]